MALRLQPSDNGKAARWQVLMSGGGNLELGGYRLYAESSVGNDGVVELEIPMRGSWDAKAHPGSLKIGLEHQNARGLVLEFLGLAWHCRVREAAWTVCDGAALIEVSLANLLAFEANAVPVLGTLIDAEVQGEVDVSLGLKLNTMQPTFNVDNLRAAFHLATKTDSGPVRCDRVGIVIGLAEKAALYLEALASLAIDLDFLVIKVQDIGLSLQWAFADLKAFKSPNFDFVWPKGVGLAIETTTGGFDVKGGGILEIDREKRSYAGALQVEIGDQAGLTLLTLINERPSFSMFALGAVTFKQGIHITNGIYLNGLGGMFGIRRSMDAQVVRDGLKQGYLESVLFPEDVVANAGRDLARLEAIFPPEDDHHLLGIMGLFSFADQPGMVKLQIALLLELPGFKPLILGRLEVRMPEEEKSGEAALVHIKGDFAAGWDFDKGAFWADASLRDSRAGPYPLTGDLAVRAGAGANRHLVISAGGTHPHYPVSQLPKMERLTLAGGKLRIKGYLAVTPNAFQAGLRAELIASAGGFSLEGWAEVDTFIRFSPFGLRSSFSAGVGIFRGSRDLFSLTLQGELEAFTPVRIHGRVRFKICWLKKITIPCNLTFGPTHTVDVESKDDELAAALKKALSLPRNWHSLPPASKTGVILRMAPESEQTVLHPMASFQVVQGVCPLATPITWYHNAPLANEARFTITSCQVGKKLVWKKPELESIKTWFSPGQFRHLDDAAKLTAKEVELMEVGIRAATDRTKSGEAVRVALAYESVILGSRLSPSRTLDAWLPPKQGLEGNEPPDDDDPPEWIHPEVPNQEIHRVYEERFIVIDTHTGEPYQPDLSPTTWHAATFQRLEWLLDPRLEATRLRVARVDEVPP